jgi:hypothetical protein
VAKLGIDGVAARVRYLREHFAERDRKMLNVHEVRKGNLEMVAADLWPDAWPKPIVANFVDTVARDLAEVTAPLPALNCASARMISDTARKFADKRTKIAEHYTLSSNLQRQMYDAVDWYYTYGFLPFIVEPDYENKLPHIRTEFPLGAYPEFDRFNRLRSYTKVFRRTVRELANLYPEHEYALRGGRAANFDQSGADNAVVDMVRYEDKDQTILYVPERDNVILESIPNPYGKLMVRVAVRPNGHDRDHQSGQFDDVIWVQIARAYMAVLGLEATEKSVQAPLALPSDVQEFAFGPDAVIRTQNPQQVKRVGLELPPGAFEEQQMLDTEQRVGARYPDARSGNVESSIITGQGVQALMGGFDTQIKAAQDVLKDVLREVYELAFCLDEYEWPTLTKTIRGETQGTPYEVSYRPDRDIKGDHTINVSYGFMAGLNPNQALVFMLQLRADKLISRDLLMRQLPFGVNISDEQAKVDTEETRDALKQAVFGLGQAVPELAAQGQDPSNTIRQFVTLIQQLNAGKSIEDAAALAFAPAPPAAAPTDGSGTPVAGDGTGGGGVPGIQPSGRVAGVAPGQAGMGPGGRPSVQQLLAGMSQGGNPTLQANVAQRVPIPI